MICKIKRNFTNHWSYISKFQLNDVLLGKALSLRYFITSLKKKKTQTLLNLGGLHVHNFGIDVAQRHRWYCSSTWKK